jgi:hypothetical protein
MEADGLQIDYQKLADNFGFKNANSTRVSWVGIKKKLDRLAGAGG